MTQLVTGSDPEILSYVKKDAIDPLEKLNLNDINFRMAFFVENLSDYMPRQDERYAKWRFVTFEVKEEGEGLPLQKIWYNLKIHKCT